MNTSFISQFKKVASLISLFLIPQTLFGQAVEQKVQTSQAMSLQQALNKAIKDRESSVENFKKNHMPEVVDEKVLAAQLLEQKNEQEKKEDRQVSSENKKHKDLKKEKNDSSVETSEPELELEE